MTDHASKVTIHMACSLDGFIARHDGSMDWFETADSYDKGMDYGDTGSLLARIDCYVMGSKTYELAVRLGWIYGDKPTTVLTHRQLLKERESVAFHSGSLTALLDDLRAAGHRAIWVVGGAIVARDFIRAGLADEITLSVLPVLLGDGVPLLAQGETVRQLHLTDVTAYRNGVVGIRYDIRKN
jgi:dihydrofolate reductase